MTSRKSMDGGAGGRWWRFSRYRYDGGFVRPAPDATLEEYDPWELPPTGRRPYERLLDLRLEFEPWPGLLEKKLVPESEQSLLAWCERYGLLGVLLHETCAVYLAPRWKRSASDGAALSAAQVAYQRTSRGWVPIETVPIAVTEPDLREEAHTEMAELRFAERVSRRGFQANDVVPDELLDWFVEPGIIRCRLSSDEMVPEPLEKTWARFFPDVPESERRDFRYPVPFSEAFWRMYCEPIDRIRDVIRVLRRALNLVRSLKPEASDDDVGRFMKGRDFLQRLASTVQPVLKPESDGTWTLRFASSTLIGTLATMATLDLAGGMKPRVCTRPGCGKLFLARRSGARYCSEACKWTQQKRVQRERLNRGKPRRPRGRPPRTPVTDADAGP